MPPKKVLKTLLLIREYTKSHVSTRNPFIPGNESDRVKGVDLQKRSNKEELGQSANSVEGRKRAQV